MTKLLEISTNQIGVFKTLFKTLGKTLINVNMIFCQTDEDNDTLSTNTGFIKIFEVNSTKSVIVDLRLEASKFTKFYCAEEKVSIGINLRIFNRLIGIITKKDISSLTMYIDYNDTKNLKIFAQNEQENNLYCMELLILKDSTVIIPPLEIESHIIMSSNQFHKTCKQMCKISEFIELKCSENEFIMSCVSAQENTKITQYATTNNITHSTENCTTQGTFFLNSIIAFKKLATMTDTVEIFLECKFPLIIRYNIPFGRLDSCFSPLNYEGIRNEYPVENDEKIEKENSVLQKNYKKLEKENKNLKIANKYASELIEALTNKK